MRILKLVALGLLAAAPALAQAPESRLWRLDCGTITIKEFNSFFSDTLDYKPGPRDVAASCYLIQHKGEYLLWDTGYASSLKGQTTDKGYGIVTVRKTIADQLTELGVKAADVDFVGISHMHGDHVGQASEFPAAKLIVGKGDFEMTRGKNDPFVPWRPEGAKVQTMHGGDIDIFGDGKVVALNLPGHTPDHMALLVKLKSGNVLLTGDMYHSTEAREVRGVPPFNSNRAETLASMDRFERLAKNLGAKVIIQHEPADISKLPAFPKAAE